MYIHKAVSMHLVPILNKSILIHSPVLLKPNKRKKITNQIDIYLFIYPVSTIDIS